MMTHINCVAEIQALFQDWFTAVLRKFLSKSVKFSNPKSSGHVNNQMRSDKVAQF